MRLHRIAVIALAAVLTTPLYVNAQYIVIRTGVNVDQLLATPVLEGKLTFGLPSGQQVTIPITYIDFNLTRAVNNAQGAPASQPPSSSSFSTEINARCAAQWKADFQMQAYCRKQQSEALSTVRNRNMEQSQDRRTIRQMCAQQWKDDFQMWNYCEEQQLKALRDLGR